MQITRRDALLGAASAAALSGPPAAITPVRAAAPQAGKQAPGFYRYKVGSFEVTAVTDGARVVPLADNFVRNAPKDAVSAALLAMHQEGDKLLFPFTPVVVNTGSHLVAIDTGNGAAAFEQSKGGVGQYHANLAASGIAVSAIDVVVISHFHGDHINGMVTADNKAAFPNAEILVPAAEWAFWMDDGNMGKAAGTPLENNFKNARRVFGVYNNKVTRYEAGKEIVSGITAVATPGHTPGHTSHILASGADRLVVQADVTAGPALLFVRNPGWHGPDMDGPTAEQTRRKLYDMAATEKMRVQAFHWPFPALGTVERDGAGYRMYPAPWMPTI